ncbi:MAG: hypothetical protein GF404_12860 [candidate division Zixibacteria bacterium]|nr:hypothetical protein [candidate division Zixibacteria bacterium]
MPKSKLVKLGTKMLHMEFPELYYRGREALGRVTERKRASAGEYLFSEEALEHIFTDPSLLRSGLAAHFRERKLPEFFRLPLASDDLELMKRFYLCETEAIIKIADDILRDRFPIFGGKTLEFGTPPDWFYDPVADIHSAPSFYADVPFLDPREVGDSKVVWELSRLKFIYPLAQAYFLTGQDFYALKAFGLIEDWLKKNPPKIGINWSSSLECAFRIYALAWMIEFFRKCELLDDRFAGMVWFIIYRMAEHIQDHLSYYFSPNTHLTGEAFGLFAAGLIFPELKPADEWREIGLKILVDELENQFTAEGAHKERSSCYHRYSADFYLHTLILCDRNQIKLPDSFREMIFKMVEYIYELRRPDGLWPQIGDSDGGKLTWLEFDDVRDYSAVLSTAAVYFDRPELWPYKPVYETAWLLGMKQVTDYEPSTIQARKLNSKLFPQAGYAVLRSEDDKSYLLFDCGKFGYKDCVHSHADSLSLELVIGKQPVLVDPGTFCYTGNPEYRNYFRSAQAHNVCLLEKRGFSEPEDIFEWKYYSDVNLQRSFACEGLDYVSASISSSRHPDKLWMRNIIRISDHYYIINDRVDTRGSEIDFLYHTPFSSHSFSTRKQQISLQDGGLRVILKPLTERSYDFKAHSGQDDPISGWYSPDYGQIEKITTLKIRPETNHQVHFPVCVFPTRMVDLPPMIEMAGHDLWNIVFEDYNDFWRFGDGDTLAFVRFDSKRKLERFFLTGIEAFTLNRKPIVQVNRSANIFGLFKGDELHLHGDLTGSLKIRRDKLKKVICGQVEKPLQKSNDMWEIEL